MTRIKRNKELESIWVSQINKEWDSFYQKNKMKFVVETNESTCKFLEDLEFDAITYSQVEEGLMLESYTIRYFDLCINSLGIEAEMTTAEILGNGFSEWKLDAETIFSRNRDGYHLEHQMGLDFSKYFESELEEDYIQKTFQCFELATKCVEFEKTFLKEDRQNEELELNKFFVENTIEKVVYTSRCIVFQTSSGESKTFQLDPEVYINHFN